MRSPIVSKALLISAAVALPLIASAASTYTSGTGALTATATVNFQINIPQTLYLRVGSGSVYPGTLATVNTTDLLQFSPAVGSVGNGTAVAGTGGDLTGGVETAAVLSNGANTVSLSATEAAAGLSDGNGDFIPFTQITTTAAANTAGYTLLQPPLLNAAGGSTSITLTPNASKVVQADAKWTFSYANSVTPPGGTYGGVGVNNSLVTYTATMP
jgi:hypothetical protein